MSELTGWMQDQIANYQAALGKVNRARKTFLGGDTNEAADLLEKSFVFAVLSIRTHVTQHELAFTRWASGGELRESIGNVQFPNQKADWIERTQSEVNFENLVLALRSHYANDRLATMLDVLDENLTGVSYRKAAFTLAMSGCHDFLCIDSHMAKRFGYEDTAGNSLSFYSGSGYLDASNEILEQIDTGSTSLPPFLKQWAEWDRLRGEHSTHQTFYHHAVGHGINPRKDLEQ